MSLPTVEAGRLTGSGMNAQPWHFIVIRADLRRGCPARMKGDAAPARLKLPALHLELAVEPRVLDGEGRLGGERPEEIDHLRRRSCVRTVLGSCMRCVVMSKFRYTGGRSPEGVGGEQPAHTQGEEDMPDLLEIIHSSRDAAAETRPGARRAHPENSRGGHLRAKRQQHAEVAVPRHQGPEDQASRRAICCTRRKRKPRWVCRRACPPTRFFRSATRWVNSARSAARRLPMWCTRIDGATGIRPRSGSAIARRRS